MIRGDIVLMDTNVIIEAHRTRCWRAVVNAFHVETVEKCCEEVATGDRRRADYVEVDVEAMRRSITVHPVSLLELAVLETRLTEPDRIDPGEKHLFAHALKRTGSWYVGASDRGAVRAGHELGFLERFVSLEALARLVGSAPQLRNHFTERWLGILRMDILGGVQ